MTSLKACLRTLRMNNKNIIEEKIILKRESYDELNQTIADLEFDISMKEKTIKTLRDNINELNIIIKSLQDYIIEDICYSMTGYFKKCTLEAIIDTNGFILKDYIDICKKLKIESQTLINRIKMEYEKYQKETERITKENYDYSRG